MKILCTRTGCPRSENSFADLDEIDRVRTVQQKFCTACGMPLILDGRYIPVELLGRGGFGAAFLGRDRRIPGMRKCVIKQFQPSGDLSPQQLQIAQSLFEREGVVLEQLGTHPQIPDLFAFFDITVPSRKPGKEDKFFYLVQKLIDGQNLEQELAQKGKFSEIEVLDVLQQILPVLRFVHEHGSIHRDIKPSNMMRDRNGQLYLLDFGAVKNVATTATTSTQSTGIYSMGFAPPEQMAGRQVYPSSDLYALAVTCIQLLTGKPPAELFDSNDDQWNWKNYVQVNSRLAAILDRMLLSTPNERFPSAQEVLDAINSPSEPPSVSQTPSQPTNPQPAVTQTQPSNPPIVPPQRIATLELLGGAAFTGFEAALLFIALGSVLKTPAISIGIWGMILGGLIYAQFRRLLAGKTLPIIAGITLAVVYFVPSLHTNFLPVVIAAVLAAAGAIAVTACFRLVYIYLSKML